MSGEQQYLSKCLERLVSQVAIRKMFEEGNRLKKLHGEENVFDFSIGNPVIDPSDEFKVALKRAVDEAKPGAHKYMVSAGYPETRTAVADSVGRFFGIEGLSDQHVCMSSGTAGAFNVVVKATCDPGDEIIVPLPIFLDYHNYVENHACKVVPVQSTDTFDLDVQAIEAGITDKTRAIVICSPNNPTGRILSKESVAALGAMLNKLNETRENIIYLMNDQVYQRLTFKGEMEPIFKHCKHSFVVSSFSKDLSLAGERLGYILVNPACPNASQLVQALAICIRILGYVNAPATMQRAIAKACDCVVDLDWYVQRRDAIYKGILEAGIECVEPQGGFFLFPKIPAGVSDEKFLDELQKRNVLCVPGAAFGLPGYFRLSYACELKTIQNAIPKFKEAVEACKN
eukprot:GFYU01015850.1.p1 GENE.GFYU01015850.1~~GFYU01015850.1.p1  ORF type:complete len:439 (-),score=124.48 GFYU01015850.1:120-1319(-)